MPLSRSICSAHTRHRSPSSTAADSPNRSGDPDSPRSRCQRANLTCADGRPRRNAEPSMTSSCKQGERMQQLEAGRGSQRRIVVVGAAQPAQVHANVDRRHLPPSRKPCSTSAAMSMPAGAMSAAQPWATKSARAASTSTRKRLRQSMNEPLTWPFRCGADGINASTSACAHPSLPLNRPPLTPAHSNYPHAREPIGSRRLYPSITAMMHRLCIERTSYGRAVPANRTRRRGTTLAALRR